MSLKYYQVCASAGWSRLEIQPVSYKRDSLIAFADFAALWNVFLNRYGSDSDRREWANALVEPYVREKFRAERDGWTRCDMSQDAIGVLDSFDATVIRFVVSSLPAAAQPPVRNAFSVLMSASASPSVLPPHAAEHTMLDAVYNDLLSLCEQNGSRFRSLAAGKDFLQNVADLIWMIEPSIATISKSTGHSFPPLFCAASMHDWTGFDTECMEKDGKLFPHVYNNWQRKKKEKPRIARHELHAKVQCVGGYLLEPWFSHPNWRWLFRPVEQVLNS